MRRGRQERAANVVPESACSVARIANARYFIVRPYELSRRYLTGRFRFQCPMVWFGHDVDRLLSHLPTLRIRVMCQDTADGQTPATLEGIARLLATSSPGGRVVHVCTAHGAVMHSSGSQLLSEPAFFGIRDGHLAHAERRSHEALYQALAQAVGGSTSTLCILAAPDCALRITATPMPEGLSGAGGLALALLVIDARSIKDLPEPSDLQLLFDLTPAEASVLVDLCMGLSLGESAARTGRSVNTLRAHVASIMEKTGARRQSALVRLAMLALP